MIEVESGESLAVYAASIKNWQPLFEGEVISEGKKAEILSRVSAALQFMEVPHVIY
ncbi:MAG: hypothetical protein LBV12_12440 [Puniceicoccales bacterium]|nr:hypothetical protein [Puniceicoccales bacterium]